MARRFWTKEDVALLIELHNEGRSFNEISKVIDRSDSSVRNKFKTLLLLGSASANNKNGNNKPLASNKESFEHKENHDNVHIRSVSERIKTVVEALERAEVDTVVWKVDRFVINSWEAPSKDSELGVTTLWQVKIWLVRRAEKPITDGLDILYQRIRDHNPAVPAVNRKPVTNDPHLLEVSLFDHHFGKLGWEPESGTEYNVKISESVYHNAVEDLLDRTSGYNIEKILFPIGNDFFHVNNWILTTQKGTPQDHDGRFQKIFEIGCMAAVKAIDRCLTVAPVEMLWVPGNHDPETSWYLARFLYAWYRNVDGVEIDNSPKFRKYKDYGVNLIGFTHGNEEKHRDLPAIMASEVPDLWAQAKFRAWHVGHLHKKSQLVHNAGDTYGGVTVSVLPSLSGTDAWHYKKGYVKSNRAAEAYLWHHDDGYAGHFSANVRLG